MIWIWAIVGIAAIIAFVCLLRTWRKQADFAASDRPVPEDYE